MVCRYGLPVVDDLIGYLKQVRLEPWPQIRPAIDLEEYMRGDLTPEQKSELRFAPKGEVLFLRQPDGKEFRGFRSVLRDWASVFTLIYEMGEDTTLGRHFVPIVCEYKHGADVIGISLPSGVPGRREANLSKQEAMLSTGKREFEEETGLLLKELVPLGNPHGLVVSARNNTQTFFPFLGLLEEGAKPRPQRLDRTEVLKTVLLPLDYWLRLIEQEELPEGYVVEVSAVAGTYLALRALKLM